jgi:lipopolysaccharide heptosyltransferase II
VTLPGPVSGPLLPLRPGTSTPGWARLRNILAVRMDAMGDVLMTTPALRAIRATAREARLTLLTSSAGAAVARHVPEIDEVIAWDPPWMKAPRQDVDAAADLGFIERLRDGRYDAAIVFTVHTQSPLPAALTCHLSGIPRCLAHCRENPYGLVSDWVPEPEPDEPIRHEVTRQLDLVRHVGYVTEDDHLSFRVPPAAMRRVRDEVIPVAGIPLGGPWAVLHPGASAPSRRYPPEGFAAAAGRLVREDAWTIVLTGGPDERELADEVARAMDATSINLAGALSLGELGALLAVAPILIANNSGPAHLAAALGTPVVDLYALTNVQHAPWQVPHRILNVDVPCRGCRRSVCPLGHHRCLTGVHPDEVVGAARALWQETRPATAGGRPGGQDRERQPHARPGTPCRQRRPDGRRVHRPALATDRSGSAAAVTDDRD